MKKDKKKASYFQHLYAICYHILTMIILQGLWVIFSVVGLGIFGLIPASVAVCHVVNVKMIQKEDEALFPLFWKTYKSSFLRANFFGLTIGMSLLLLWINRIIIQLMNGGLAAFFHVGSYLVLFFTLLLLLYGIAFLAVTQQRLLGVIKASIMLGLCRPLETLSMLAVTLGVCYFYSLMPSIIPLFGIVPLFVTYTLISNLVWKRTMKTAVSGA